MGLGEATGCSAAAVCVLSSGYLAERYRLRLAPFLLGLAYPALALLSGLFVLETSRLHTSRSNR